MAPCAPILAQLLPRPSLADIFLTEKAKSETGSEIRSETCSETGSEEGGRHQGGYQENGPDNTHR
jgi:hypothetical protein